MFTKYLGLILFEIFLKFHIIWSDENCLVTQKPKLQIVFVLDQVMKDNYDNHAKLHTDSASALFDLFKQNSFEAEYAVTGFVNYPDSAAPKGISNPELCYFLIQDLTTDKTKLIAALAKDYFPQGSTNTTAAGNVGTESVTTAMLFSAVDKKLKWNSGFYDKNGNLVRKIMILMIYKGFSTYLQNPGNRKPPKADGTDTCATALIPEIEQLDQVLFDNQFFVINSIMNIVHAVDFKTEKLYADLFDSMYVVSYQAPVPKSKTFVNVSNFNPKAYAKDVYDIVLKEVMSCDWEDPVGYNTLGL